MARLGETESHIHEERSDQQPFRMGCSSQLTSFVHVGVVPKHLVIVIIAGAGPTIADRGWEMVNQAKRTLAFPAIRDIFLPTKTFGSYHGSE